MKTFIVAIPFFDSNMSVDAYRLSSRSGKTLLGMLADVMSVSDAVLSPGLDLIKTLGVEPLTGGAPLFVDINEYHLLMRIPIMLEIDPELMVCVLPNHINADGAVLEKIAELKEHGFAVASDGLLPGNTKSPLFELVDYIIIDISDFTNDNKFVETVKALSTVKKIVLSEVNDMKTFEKLAGIPNTYYCGRFFNQPITKGVSKISPLKINALTLLKRINEEDFDLGDIADTVGQDPFLSISLLRFINTIMPKEIESLRTAVTILGQKEVKRWATAAISIRLADDRPNEVTKLSLIRARFAENLARAFDLAIFSQSLFMLGLFSLIDVILELPMEQAVDQIAVDEQVKEALVKNEGDYYKVLQFINAYEHADWDEIAILMVKHNLQLDDVTSAFVDALVWYKALLDAITDGENKK
ncbi:MAG: HDOD domain-containing protein [Oscillospiraceae bacterium]|nr:HDOD domain-containing protein [Oscillospiraceae bacterium]MCL2279167.1 HDOD domain-containing protein [Oscillospiraceae bacterium]